MKKILLLFIAVLICFNMTPMVFAADDLQEKIDYISSLGIMTGYEDGSFGADNLITRAEFTSAAVRLAGQADSANAGMYDGRFSDVSPDFWGAGYIAVASNMGIINGYTDGTFLPNNNVTYNEAIKMIVCLLGYGLQAEKLGGYPTGYTAVASRLKLLDFKYFEPTSPINRGEVVRLIYNSLDVEIMITQSIGSDGVYEIGKGGTVLETIFSAERKKGIVTGTALDSLHRKKLSAGYVEIDDIIYKTEIDCAGLLGEKVEYVAANADDGKKVVYIKPDAVMRSISVNSEDIVDVGGIFTSNGQLRYWSTNRKVRNVPFTAAVNVIYNNKILSSEAAGSVDFNQDPNVYECFDTDNDGVFDILKMKSYNDYYIKKVYTDKEKQIAVTDDNMLITNDPDDEDLFIRAVFDGEIVPFDEIKEGDIVSVAKSLDSNAYEVIISRESFEGSVSVKTQDDTDIILSVGGSDYPVSKTLINKQKIPAVNDSGKFYLNFRGEIAYYEGTDTSDGQYGFLTAVESKGGIGGDCSIKILETSNVFSVYPIAKKVQFSNKGVKSTKTANEIVSIFYRSATWDDVREAHTQIIRYKLNSDGEVNYIATAKDTPDENSFSICAPNRKYFYSNSLFEQKWKITSDTIVFYIPSTKQGEDYTRYRAGRASKYFANGNTYQVQLYDVDENGEVGAVFYSLTGQLREPVYSIDYAASKIMTIDKVAYTTDEDGITRCTVSGIVDNNYTSVYVSDEFLTSASNKNMLKFGNVIQYQTDSARIQAAYYDGESAEIVKAILWCDFDTTFMRKLYNGSSVEQRSPKITTVYGTVLSVDNTKVSIGLRSGEQTDVFIADTQEIVKIDSAEKKLDMGKFYDIQPGKKIFVRMRYDRIKDVVIHE